MVEIRSAVVCTQYLLKDPTLLPQLQGSDLSADALGLFAVRGLRLCLQCTDNIGMLMGQGHLVAGEALWQVGVTVKTELTHLLDQVRLRLGSEENGLHVHDDMSGEIVLEEDVRAGMAKDLVPKLFADALIYDKRSANHAGHLDAESEANLSIQSPLAAKYNRCGKDVRSRPSGPASSSST